MKTFIIVPLLMSTLALSANELDWVDEQVEAIKPSRLGMKSQDLARIKDPFIFLKKNKKKSEKKTTTSVAVASNVVASSSNTKTEVKPRRSLELSMVMNKSVLISGKWYRLGDSVSGYKIEEIHMNSVLLTKKKKRLLLSTASKTKTLNFKNQ